MSVRACLSRKLGIPVLLLGALVACSDGTGPATLVPAKLAFTVQPTNATAGSAFTPALTVTIEDSSGHPVTSATNVVTVAIDTGLPGLSGATTVTAVNGVATFGNLSIQRAGSGYFLTASSGTLTRARSSPFDIAPAAPARLIFLSQPSSAESAQVITPAVEVGIQDAFGNSVPGATNAVTITIGTNPSGGALSGTTMVSAVSGVATFANLVIDRPGIGYTLAATASGLPGSTSSAFNIKAPLLFAGVSAGGRYTCVVTRGGAAYCWGSDGGGALGTGTTTGPQSCSLFVGFYQRAYIPCSRTPVAVSGGLAFAAVSAGGGQACGLTPARAPYCWGSNGSGELGNGTTTGPQSCLSSFVEDLKNSTFSRYIYVPCSSSPIAVSGGPFFAAVSAGDDLHTCGVTPVGAAYCWGGNTYGQLGKGDTTGSTTPVLVSGGLSFSAVSAGSGHTCGLTAAGAGYCWGQNANGELGNGNTTNSPIPVAVSGGLTFAAVSAGGDHTCGLTAGGAAYCWGNNAYGELGDGTTANTPTPIAVSGGFTFAALSAGGDHTCGLTAGGAAYCWGNNYRGKLGNGTTTDSPIPAAVSGGLGFAALSAGGDHTCGLTAGGAAYCWGSNDLGQLGNGTSGMFSYSSVPVRVIVQ